MFLRTIFPFPSALFDFYGLFGVPGVENQHYYFHYISDTSKTYINKQIQVAMKINR